MSVIDIYNTNNKYDIIYTDPPWHQSKGNKRKCRPKQGKRLDYPTCSMDELKEIHEAVVKLCNKKHNIFMWTIDKYLHEAEQMMKQLGYELHARIIWDKGNGIAPAFTVRFSHEYLLWFYKRGDMLMPQEHFRGKYTTVLREKSTYHSHKPLCAYEMLENLFPNSQKLEVFARNERSGWDCWGNEMKIEEDL